MKTLLFLFVLVMPTLVFSQTLAPDPAPGVSQDLARWRAERYSDVRYKLSLTLEKMSPVLKGTLEVRVKVSEPPASAGGQSVNGTTPPIILDWRRIKGHEEKSTISDVVVNGRPVAMSANWPPADAGGSDKNGPLGGADYNEHLIFRDGVFLGENVIKLDFTSPILTSGSAITRYVDKEDGSEYIYSLFVPSDASTAFPVFDQPDLKARFDLDVDVSKEWSVISNSSLWQRNHLVGFSTVADSYRIEHKFYETKPISTYVFAFAAGPWERVAEPPALAGGGAPNVKSTSSTAASSPPAYAGGSAFVRRSQAAKFKPHAAEVFRLNREAVKYFERYFDYKFPFPKYDLVLIPEFPFGGMEHAGATFLRESAIIFPQEPTRNDIVSRATLIFHEAAHQWFGDTVTMRWFDDLWLKEGFATFTAYKALEKIMPEMNAWKVFYERVKQAAYQTDSTKGTTPIYQEIPNLSAAKSAYGNIVYNKAPAFLRQAEFYLGEDKFQTAVRAFLKKHEFENAGWEDLVKEFEASSGEKLQDWSHRWIKVRGLAKIRSSLTGSGACVNQEETVPDTSTGWGMKIRLAADHGYDDGHLSSNDFILAPLLRPVPVSPAGKILSRESICLESSHSPTPRFAFPNYGDYGYGIFLLDEKSRDYVLKNIQNEKDPFLRSMMWGALWDSVREGELDPRVFVELVVKVLSSSSGGQTTPSAEAAATPPKTGGEFRTTPSAQSGGHPSSNQEGNEDESTVATLLGRAGTALNYYIDDSTGRNASVNERASGGQRPNARSLTVASPPVDLRSRVENMLIERMRNAPTLGQRITYYRAFLNVATSEKARGVLKGLLKQAEPPASAGGKDVAKTGLNKADGAKAGAAPPAYAGGSALPLKTKDKFDIVTRLLVLGDPDAQKLLADLEKTETSDDAKRYAYAAKAGVGTAETKAKYWNDFVNNKEISESWIEAAFGPWNSIRHSELTLPYLERALRELPNHKRSRKIFFVNGWLGAFIGGQRSEEALAVVNKFLADNPKLDNDLRLKILENVDVIERAVRIRSKSQNRLR